MKEWREHCSTEKEGENMKTRETERKRERGEEVLRDGQTQAFLLLRSLREKKYWGQLYGDMRYTKQLSSLWAPSTTFSSWCIHYTAAAGRITILFFIFYFLTVFILFADLIQYVLGKDVLGWHGWRRNSSFFFFSEKLCYCCIIGQQSRQFSKALSRLPVAFGKTANPSKMDQP